MKIKCQLIIASILLIQCSDNDLNYKARLNVDTLPNESPIPFKTELVLEGKLIHRGILNPELDAYYFTLSDKDFTDFDISFIERKGGKWSEPKKALFNSEHNDHGMSFSPDGNNIYFSSTRPIKNEDLPETWHLWQIKKSDRNWAEPEYVDIPNMRDKLLSHPTITNDGRLFFHASDLDYSEMDIYYSEYKNGKFRTAKKVFQKPEQNNGRCTPFVAADGSYLVYASIKKHLELMVSFWDEENDEWGEPEPLPKIINTNGQGNPFVTTDGKFLFYATELTDSNWSVHWINIRSFLDKD